MDFLQPIEKLAGAIMGSGAKVSQVDKNRRLGICRNCALLFKPTMQCKSCKCFVNAKTEYKNEKCPLNKW